jgi:MSHA pilin protein MshD
MTSAAQRGFTLIELLFFNVVVSAGLAGILSVMNTTVQFSAEPMARKQAMVLAESVLEEIVQKDYADTDLLDLDPDLDPKAEHVKDRNRAKATVNDGDGYGYPDDVDDYYYDDVYDDDMIVYDEMIESILTDGPDSLSDYVVTIDVQSSSWSVDSTLPLPILPVPVKKITVTVTGGGQTISLSGYRADY